MRKVGPGGLPPPQTKIIKIVTSRMSENALLGHGIKAAIIIFVSRRSDLTFSRTLLIASVGASGYAGSSERSFITTTFPSGHSAYTSVNVPPLSIANRYPCFLNLSFRLQSISTVPFSKRFPAASNVKVVSLLSDAVRLKLTQVALFSA